MNDMSLVDQPKNFPIIDLENPEMISQAIQSIANAFVRASELAQIVKAMQRDMEELRQQVAEHKHHKEIADAAYNQVNAARIEAENHCVSLRTERNALEQDNNRLVFEIGDIKAKVAEVEAEIIRIRDNYEAKIAGLVEERDRAIEKAKDATDLYNLAEEDKRQQAITIKGLEDELAKEKGAATALREANGKLQEVIAEINKVLQPGGSKANSHWQAQPRDPATQRWIPEEPTDLSH